MKISILSTITLLAALLMIVNSPAYAHKIRTFAYESGGEIITETVFSSGRPAKGATIEVMTTTGEIILTGKSDDKGIFSFAIPEEARDRQLNLNIVADVGEGHQGSWLLNAEDYLTGLADKSAPASNPPSTSVSLNEEVQKSTIQDEMSCSELEQRLQEMLVKELSPIKRQLAEQQTEKTSLKDILSGLGYIFGLAGIILYYQSKKQRSKK
ncbi:MAG: hypothetical protein QNJ17_10395 [Desulfocapsaceae bacterium]|nr:hypothetical protein [Desulfocapsaceae bacterium]